MRTCKKASHEMTVGNRTREGHRDAVPLQAPDSLPMQFKLRRSESLYMSAIADALNTTGCGGIIVGIFLRFATAQRDIPSPSAGRKCRHEKISCRARGNVRAGLWRRGKRRACGNAHRVSGRGVRVRALAAGDGLYDRADFRR